MALRSQRSRFPSQSERHRTSWDPGPSTSGNGGPQAVSSSSANFAGTAISILIDSFTLVRTRGELTLWLMTATAAGDGFHGAFGIAKATSVAVVAGSTPTPMGEKDWDGWLYHRFFSLFAAGPIAVATAAQEALQTANVTAALRVDVDSKAMRKADDEESFFAVIEVVEHGTATMEWAFNSRILSKDMG